LLAEHLTFHAVGKRIKYQFVIVATAAPFCLIGRELISVGYNQGTPSIPTPKEMKYRKKKAIAALDVTGEPIESKIVMTKKDRNCPLVERSIKPRRPTFSTSGMAKIEAILWNESGQECVEKVL